MDLETLFCNHHTLGNCDCCIFTKDMVRMPRAFLSMRHYHACVLAAMPVLQSMVSDLITHDRHTLAGEDPATPFVFAVSASSTHLIRLRDRDRRHWAPEFPTWIGDCYGANQPISWFLWDGERMLPLSDYKEAIEVLYEECAKIGLTPG